MRNPLVKGKNLQTTSEATQKILISISKISIGVFGYF
jgi:hypothetical protein